MDTWGRRFKYNKFNKLIAIILIMAFATGLIQGLYALAVSDSHELEKNDYFETQRFMDGFVTKSGYVRDWIVRYSDEDAFKESSIPKDQIEEYARSIAIKEDKQNNLNQYTEEAYKKQEIDKIEAYKKQAIEQIIQDRRDYYSVIQQQLTKDNANYIFLARDNNTGKVITNVEAYNGGNADDIIRELAASPAYMKGDAERLEYTSKSYLRPGYYYRNLVASNYYGGEALPEGVRYRYEIHTALRHPIVMTDTDYFYMGQSNFDTVKQYVEEIYKKSFILMALGLVGIAYLTYAAGRSSTKEGLNLTAFDKIPFEIQGFGIFAETYIITEIGSSIMRYKLRLTNSPLDYIAKYLINERSATTIMGLNVSLLLSIIGVLSALAIYMSMVRHIKNHTFLKNFLIIKIIIKLKDLFVGLFIARNLPVVLVIAVGGYVFINTVFIMITFGAGSIFFLFLTAILNLGMMVIVFKFGADCKQLIRGANDIARGNIEHKINIPNTLPAISQFADTINNIGEGMSGAVQKATKSERMKTELITNVSHDLKTPLTSIISYIELLKGEEIKNDVAKDYIAILAERSERLKQLIEDLVEASKATTGNMKVDREAIELHQLVQQLIGEYNDRLEEINLEIVFSKLEQVGVLGDRRHMWRILENILSNVKKYAMPHTRVYIEVLRERQYGVLTVKNISKDPLTIDSSELTERFVRADASRSEEGSGLGLAIAQSLATLQNGDLQITTDGDLFKVVVKIPLVE